MICYNKETNRLEIHNPTYYMEIITRAFFPTTKQKIHKLLNIMQDNVDLYEEWDATMLPLLEELDDLLVWAHSWDRVKFNKLLKNIDTIRIWNGLHT